MSIQKFKTLNLPPQVLNSINKLYNTIHICIKWFNLKYLYLQMFQLLTLINHAK